MTSSRARRREEARPRCGGGPRVQVSLAGLTAPFAFPLTAASSLPRKMFSSVAHLARANPFNAPHLQLVQDGLAGPRSNPAGPPGPPRRSRKLAAAAVEGEVTPCPDTVVRSPRGPLGLRGVLGPEDREGRALPATPQDGAQLLVRGCQLVPPEAGCRILGSPSRAWKGLGPAPSVTSASSREWRHRGRD